MEQGFDVVTMAEHVIDQVIEFELWSRENVLRLRWDLKPLTYPEYLDTPLRRLFTKGGRPLR